MEPAIRLGLITQRLGWLRFVAGRVFSLTPLSVLIRVIRGRGSNELFRRIEYIFKIPLGPEAVILIPQSREKNPWHRA